MVDDLIPVSDEQAKAIASIADVTGKGIDTASKFLSYWAGVFDAAPHDLFALLIGDRLHHARIRKLFTIMQETETIIERRRVKEPQAPSEDIAIPLLEAARQSRDEFQHLWARLLANAMDPAKASIVRLEFIETLKRLHPLDALNLHKLVETPGVLTPNTRDYLSTALKVPTRAVVVSLQNLESYKCVGNATPSEQANYYVTAYGAELVAACSG